MSEAAKIYQLIVRQRPAPGADLDALLATLQAEYGLDSYTARQRLLGAAHALFGKGPLEKTGKIRDLLQHYGFASWLIEPQKPGFAPDRLLGLEIHPEYILFTCRKGEVRLDRQCAVVGVLGDVSGALADKHVKRLLAQNAYRGAAAVEVLGRDEMLETVLRGQPVFDFYLLADDGAIREAVRVLPGRFNVDGLGARAGMSSRQNLQAVVSLVEEYAAPFRLHVDYGLSQFPDGQPKRLADAPAAVMENLDSLTRYGWLMSRLQGSGLPGAPAEAGSRQATAAAIAAVAGQPALGAILAGGDSVAAVPGLGEVAGELQQAIDDNPPGRTASAEAEEARGSDLPPPPEAPEKTTRLSRMALTVAGALVGFFLAIGSGGGELFRLVAHYGTTAGVVPALISVALLWSGVHFIVLKRLVENTPTSRVRSIAMGMVEVHGRARRLYALVAPMTQSACAWYRLRKFRRDRNERWKLVSEIDSSHVPFQIDDGTGRVTVAPEGATIRPQAQHSGVPGQSPLTFTAFGGSLGDDEKWVEDIIYEGTSLYVLGYAQPLREEKEGLRERTMAKLRQLKLDPRALHRYDTDGDGRIDEQEWEAARSDVEQEALREHLGAQGERKRQEDHVVIGDPRQRSLPFIIAETVSEAELAKKYGWISIPLLLAGTAAAVLALYKFLQFVRL